MKKELFGILLNILIFLWCVLIVWCFTADHDYIGSAVCIIPIVGYIYYIAGVSHEKENN